MEEFTGEFDRGSTTKSVQALVAQWTEQQPSKLLVVGSNPAEGAR